MTATITVSSAPPSAHIVYESADLPAGAHTLRVVRSWDTFTADVRGWSNGFADGGAVVDDFEIPLGVPVTYTGEAFNSSGVSLGAVDAVTASVAGDPSIGWISDPTDQTSPVRVELKGDFASTLTRVRQVQTYPVGNRVVALLGALGKLSSIPLRVQTKTLEDAASLSAVLGQTSILIRTAPPTRQPRLLYVVVPQVDELPQNVQFGSGWTIFDMTGDEIDAATLDILIPVTTWQTYMDAFDTWADMEAAYDTWFDAKKNPPT